MRYTSIVRPSVFYGHFYRPQRSCGQGYVFTRVCDSVHRGGSPENPPRTRQTPPPPPRQGEPPQTRQTPPGPGRPPGTRQTPPGRENPPDQADPPGTRQTPPLGPRRTPPAGRTPPPGRRLQHTVNERPVRILLECILVSTQFKVAVQCRF